MKNLKIFSTVAEYQAYSATTTDAHLAYITAIDKCVCSGITPLVPPKSTNIITIKFTTTEANQEICVFSYKQGDNDKLWVDGTEIKNPKTTLTEASTGAYSYVFENIGEHVIEICPTSTEITNGYCNYLGLYNFFSYAWLPCKVTIGEGITELGEEALGYGENIEEFNWGKNITSMGKFSIFCFASNVTINFNGTMAELRAKVNCGEEDEDYTRITHCTDGDIHWAYPHDEE